MSFMSDININGKVECEGNPVGNVNNCKMPQICKQWEANDMRT